MVGHGFGLGMHVPVTLIDAEASGDWTAAFIPTDRNATVADLSARDGFRLLEAARTGGEQTWRPTSDPRRPV